jgi:hypothetical protein
MKKTIICFVLMVFWVGCQSKKSIVLPFEGKKLFIDGALSDDGTAEINISRTYPPTGSFKEDTSYFKSITGELYENNIRIAQIKQKSRNTFVLDKKINVNFSSAYFIKVRADDFPEVISDQVYFPKKLDLVSFDFTGTTRSNLAPQTEVRIIKVSFKDQDPKINYYEIKIKTFDKENKKLNPQVENLDENPSAENGCSFISGHFILTSDLCMLGNVKKVKIGYSTEENVRDSYEPLRAKKMELSFKNISYNQYLFITGESGNSGLEQAFSTKPPRFSNVKNGYGAFFANTVIEKEVKF